MSQELQNYGNEKKGMGNEWFWAVAAAIYMFSPVDIIPDIPVVGWVDDVSIVTSAGLNLIQGYAAQNNESLARVIGFFKWIVIIVGVIAVLLVLLLGTLIIKMFS